MSLTISIVTPSFNQGKFIERTIQSVIQQNNANLKHIIMDGGSQDETISVLKRYQDQVTWTSESDKGQAHAINKSICISTSDIIGWLNSDDVYCPLAISTILNYFEQHPDVDVIYGKSDLIDENDRIIGHYPTEQWNTQRLKKTCYISQPAVFFRRRVVLEHGFLNENLQYCMDYEYWLRLAMSGARWAYLPITLACSRIYPETKTSRGAMDASIEAINMLQSKLGYVPTEWLFNHALLSSRKHLSQGKLSYVMAIILYVKLLVQQNGWWRGMIAMLLFPKTVVQMLSYKYFKK